LGQESRTVTLRAWLKDIRDATVHLKELNQYVGGTEDKQTLYYQLLNQDPRDFPRWAVAMMRHFTPVGTDAWLIPAEMLLKSGASAPGALAITGLGQPGPIDSSRSEDDLPGMPLARRIVACVVPILVAACGAHVELPGPAAPSVYSFATDTHRVDVVAPGVTHRFIYSQTGPWAIHVLDVDLAQCYTAIAVKGSDGAAGRMKTSAMLANLRATLKWTLGAGSL
jgi:hypothetical protein